MFSIERVRSGPTSRRDHLVAGELVVLADGIQHGILADRWDHLRALDDPLLHDRFLERR